MAIQRKNGSVEVFDTDETPAAYIFSVKERKLIADQFAEAQKKTGSNKLVFAFEAGHAVEVDYEDYH